MKKLFILLFIASPAITCLAQSVLPADAGDCARIFFKALQEKDSQTLQSIITSDFSVTSFDGRALEGNFLIRAIGEGLLSVDSGMLSGTRTRSYGDVGIVQGNWSARGKMQNVSFNNDLAYMLVAVKAGGSWKVAALQFTPLR
ncbi:MAG TPA: nuclear transport factor 2 family protein [Dyadobacter sp.]|nr:nuclear transport factor 2 family protein [Dyadobacter sp.]